MGASLRVSIGQHSDPGRKAVNQDFHGVLLPEGALLGRKGIAIAVADGISSSAVSQVAAQAAVKSFLSDYYCTSDSWSVRNAASRVIAATNSWLHAETKRSQHGTDPDRGYVCTFSAMVVKGRQAHLFHVGDSRIGRLSGDSIEPLTTDHRVVLSSVQDYLGRALGMAANVEIDYRVVDLREGDVFVFTTDGVHGHLPGRDLARLLTGDDDLDRAARHGVQAALDNGSDDNLTLQVVRIDCLPAPDADQFADHADELTPPPLTDNPTDIDGYRILRTLHANARSRIYLAQPPDGTAPVALKVPAQDIRGDKAHLRRLMMEEWIARRIASPHVLKAAPAPAERRYLYTVTEYVEGQTLRQWMLDNPKPRLEQVRDLVEQIAKGLRAFHRKEMLHQDLRPENVLIDNEGTARIIDFGSTRVAGIAETQGGADDPILGTVQYTAPEYFIGEPAGPTADLFSLAVIAYEMLTGRLPYGTKVSHLRDRKGLGKLRYVPAADDKGRVPDWVDAALRAALAPDPFKRTQLLSEFTEDLRRPNPSFDPHARPSLMDRNPLMFWQVLSAVLAVAVVALLATR
ncbi:MAG: protein kinase [Magnetospirillum sp.]